MIVGISNGDLACSYVDRSFHCGLELRAFLDNVILQQPESAALRKCSGLFVNRAVRKFKRHPARDAIALRDLRQVAIGDGLAIWRPQHEEAVTHALAVTYLHRLGLQRCQLKETRY